MGSKKFVVDFVPVVQNCRDSAPLDLYCDND